MKWCYTSLIVRRLLIICLYILLYTNIAFIRTTGVLAVSWSYDVKDVCQGTSNGISVVDDSPENRIAALRNRYSGCKYVDGNLEITGLNHEDFLHKDLSFLNSIQEVTGYVLIMNVFVSNVTLANLTLIRGDTLFKPPAPTLPVLPSNITDTAASSARQPSSGYSLYVSLNWQKYSDAVGMRLLGLKALAEISKGDVFFENNNLLCYATANIYWADILASSQQGIRIHNDVSRSRSCEPKCHSSCAAQLGEATQSENYCWGPGPKNCQIFNKVTCSSDCKNRCYGAGEGQCCQETCAGGCDGPMSTDCWGCKDFYNDGGCVKYCPPPKIYDQVKFEWIPNPNRKLTFGKLCVTQCPRGFLEHNSGCLRSCPEGYESKDDQTCVKCKGPCAKRCKIKWDYLNYNNSHELEGCTTIDGHLRIFKLTFNGDPDRNIPAMPVERLQVLKSVKTISDYLLVQLVDLPELKSLNFLSNLEKIQGQDKDRFGASLNIMNNPSLEYLGLTSLRTITTGLVLISNNTKLCYLDSLKWSKLADGPIGGDEFIHSNANNTTYCEPKGAVCDSECKNGCWGPGDTQCMSCRNAKYRDHCIHDCSAPLLFSIPGNKECQDCHSQCKSACTGPTAKDCDECKVYKDGPNCVEECPNDHEEGVYKYPDVNGTCQTCHANCIEGCSGPGNFIGVGGCSKCEVSIASDDKTEIVECLDKEAECPKGYYADRNPREPLDYLVGHGVVCTRCHPLCEECDARGNYRCIKCKHFRNEDSTCVETCPSITYTDIQTKTCLSCHHSCRRECTGPTEWDCLNCIHHKVFNDSRPVEPTVESVNITDEYNTSYSIYSSSGGDNVSTGNPLISTTSQPQPKPFYCTGKKECPADKPVPRLDDNGMETVCMVRSALPGKSDRTQHVSVQTIIGSVLGTIAVLALIGLIVFCYLRRRAERINQRLKWTRILTGDELPPSTAAPDMSKLRLIQEGELRRGGILGSGAFGTVYKGVWLPEGENIKIPVAIKILQEGNSTNHNKELLEEARVMASVDHQCCVRIVAVCMTEQIMLVTQLMPLGCLLDYIKIKKDNICSKVMLNWCTQIARGMQYLESKGIVHRDLAARNVLVRNSNQVKITDFGLAKLLDYNEGEYTSAGGKMPIKWLALESIQHRKFTHKTDVWSYGVTLWEMFTYGQKPYESNRASEVPDLLEKGERLPQPIICTIDVYMIMIKCWMIDADSRPSFAELTDEFAKMARDPGRYLVIKGDSLMRLPSSSVNARDMLRNSSVASDGPEEFMEVDDYLHTGGDLDISTADMTDINMDSDTVIDMDPSSGYRVRNGSLNSRTRDNQNGSLRSSTYPRRLGHVYMNGFIPVNGSNPVLADDSSVAPSRESLNNTQDRRRQNNTQQNGSRTSVNSISKPLNYTSSTTRIEELERENQDEVIVPPDYEDFTSSNRGLSKSNSGRQHPPVYEDDYLQPRSKANGRRKQNSHQYINVELPDHQAPTPPTSAPLTKDKAASIFSYELSDLPQSNDKNNFGNPEYFDTAAADNDEVDDGISSDELEDLETNLCDPLLPHNNKDYYNSVAAFGSDSSARDSFISN